MSKMYLMCGLSGSGKTTQAKKFASENHLRYLSIDDFYAAVFGTPHIHKNEFEVWMMFYQAIHIAIKDGVDIIIDTNSPTRANRQEILNWFGSYFDEKYLWFVYADKDICSERNRARGRKVPQEEFERMIKAFEKPGSEEYKDGWTKVLITDNN